MTYRRVNLDDDAREVLKAIYRGKHTFNDIRRATKCTPERVSEALAALLFTHGAIRTERSAGARHYLPAIAPAPKRRKRDPEDEASLALSFSTLPGLMPLRPTLRVTEVRSDNQ